MSTIEPSRLQQILRDDATPGVLYMLIWSELEEDTDAYRALSDVLFAHESVTDPDDAPARDLSDPTVRNGVADCAARFPEIHAAAERVIVEIDNDTTLSP
jgi:hypothetical protein